MGYSRGARGPLRRTIAQGARSPHPSLSPSDGERVAVGRVRGHSRAVALRPSGHAGGEHQRDTFVSVDAGVHAHEDPLAYGRGAKAPGVGARDVHVAVLRAVQLAEDPVADPAAAPAVLRRAGAQHRAIRRRTGRVQLERDGPIRAGDFQRVNGQRAEQGFGRGRSDRGGADRQERAVHLDALFFRQLRKPNKNAILWRQTIFWRSRFMGVPSIGLASMTIGEPLARYGAS